MCWKQRREYAVDEMDWYCSTCRREGTVTLSGWDLAPEKARYVVCKDCGEESGYGWCPKCGMGGQFIQNLTGHPAEWICPSCKTSYPLPFGFYQEPTLFQPVGPIVDLIGYKPLLDYFPSERSRLIVKQANKWLLRITIGTMLSFVIGLVLFLFAMVVSQEGAAAIGGVIMLSSGAALILSGLSNFLLGSVASFFRFRELWKHKKYRRKFLIRLVLILAAVGMAVAGVLSIGKWENQFFAIGLLLSMILFLISRFIR